MDLSFRHRFALIDGVRLHWAEIGALGDQPPVILLHGLNDSHRTWRTIAINLAKRRQVLMPDMPGHGFSDRPDASYELSWYAHLIAGWIKHLGLSQVDVVGHSFGGGVGQMLLLDSGERIRRLALIAPGGLGREIAMILRLASIPHVIERLGQPFMAIATHLALRWARDGRTPEDIQVLCKMNAQYGSARAFARTVRGIINWRGQRHIYHQRIHEVSHLPPICILWGERDPIIPAKHGQLISEVLEGVQLVLFKGSGHYVHYEQPELVAETLKEFLGEISVPPVRIRARSWDKGRGNLLQSLKFMKRT